MSSLLCNSTETCIVLIAEALPIQFIMKRASACFQQCMICAVYFLSYYQAKQPQEFAWGIELATVLNLSLSMLPDECLNIGVRYNSATQQVISRHTYTIQVSRSENFVA